MTNMTAEERAEKIYEFWCTAHNTELIKMFIAKEIYAAMAEASGVATCGVAKEGLKTVIETVMINSF